MRGPSATLRPVNTISVREAEAEFGIPNTTISGWARRGLIRIARPAKLRGQPVLLVRADVELAAAEYKAGRGHWNPRAIAEVATAS